MEAVLLCSIHEASAAVYQPRTCAIISRAELLTVEGAWPSEKLIVFAPPATLALPVAVCDHFLRFVVICFYSPIGLRNPAMWTFFQWAVMVSVMSASIYWDWGGTGYSTGVVAIVAAYLATCILGMLIDFFRYGLRRKKKSVSSVVTPLTVGEENRFLAAERTKGTFGRKKFPDIRIPFG
jgi:hypothetical protein